MERLELLKLRGLQTSTTARGTALGGGVRRDIWDCVAGVPWTPCRPRQMETEGRWRMVVRAGQWMSANAIRSVTSAQTAAGTLAPWDAGTLGPSF